MVTHAASHAHEQNNGGVDADVALGNSSVGRRLGLTGRGGGLAGQGACNWSRRRRSSRVRSSMKLALNLLAGRCSLTCFLSQYEWK